MKKIAVTAAVALFFVAIATTASAQVTGVPTINSVYDQLRKQTAYAVELRGNQVVLRDRENGSEVVWLQQVSPQCVKVEGEVGNIHDAASATQTLARMSLLNFSSRVGTWSLDNGSGAITMSHNLNPRFLSVPAIANTALLCCDAVRRTRLL
ncbi:MAG: DUF4179 domain-containing protein [Chlorobi bacterium CHB2]|nr:DUF4179 domain-containing protein [Chlorobi bacterium CHB2]